MKGNVILRAGTPNDENRDYLPEAIKGSDMVVNENGNNSQPYPERLLEQTGVLADGLTDRWYEYVPANYDGTKPVPLVVGCHGGLMTGWGHAIYTSWTMVADREGFICAFPDAHQARIWQVEGMFSGPKPDFLGGSELADVPDDYKQNHDMNFILALIARMQQKYNIDPGRIFMQGMSAGNLFTAQFCRYYGDILAGAAGSGGPTELSQLFTPAGELKNRAGHLPVWQARPETNGTPPGRPYGEALLNRFNRFYWMELNGCEKVPEISIRGENNFAFYKGEKGDVVYHDIKNRDHGQTLDEAFLYWDYLFSGTRRNPDGTITHTETFLPRRGDEFAVAFTEGSDKAWFHNEIVPMSHKAIKWQKLKYHGLNGGQRVRGEYLCVPLSFLAEVSGAQYLPSEDTLTARLILPDGRTLQFARGSIGCVIDNDLRSMYCEALHRDGELLVGVEWFCRYLLNLQVTACNDTVYITDHFATLSANMADVIRELLYGKLWPDSFRYMEYREVDGSFCAANEEDVKRWDSKD